MTTASEHILPGSLVVFRARHPHVQVVVRVGPRDQVWGWLDNHDVDVALAGRPPAGRPPAGR